MKFANLHPETAYAIQLTSADGEGDWFFSAGDELVPLGPLTCLYFTQEGAESDLLYVAGETGRDTRVVRITLTPEVV